MDKAFFLVVALVAMTTTASASPPALSECPASAVEAENRTALAIKTKGTSAQREGGKDAAGAAAAVDAPEAGSERSALAIKTKGTSAQKQAGGQTPGATDCDDLSAK